MIKFANFTWVHYFLISSPFSEFSNFPNNVHFSRLSTPSSNTVVYIAFSHVSFISFNLEQFLIFSLSFMKLIFLESIGELFSKAFFLSLDLSDFFFFIIRFRSSVFYRTITEVILCLHCITLGSMRC